MVSNFQLVEHVEIFKVPRPIPEQYTPQLNTLIQRLGVDQVKVFPDPVERACYDESIRYLRLHEFDVLQYFGFSWLFFIFPRVFLVATSHMLQANAGEEG